MDEAVNVSNEYYIQTASSLVDIPTRVLKHGETFAVFDRFGDIHPIGGAEQGLYHEGTRFLSRFVLRLNGERLLHLSSTIRDDNALLAADLTNPDIHFGRHLVVARGTLHIHRTKFLWQGRCYERIHLQNFGLHSVNVSLMINFEADFADIFEVRGVERSRRGRRLPTVVDASRVTLAYEGLDGVVRRTQLDWLPHPDEVTSSYIRYERQLKSKEGTEFLLIVSCEAPDHRQPVLSYEEAFSKSQTAIAHARSQYCDVYTSNEQFNDWLNRSTADLFMLVSETPHGIYPYAGVPWFSTVFGRDGIITALETLWVNPHIARGVLACLAATQAQEEILERDAQPGKILHETRKGEMANLGEVPFDRYYGSVDATPLFVMLAGAYYERTGDRAFIQQIWANIELALKWIDEYGDIDGDGFIDYLRYSHKGLVNQGWKDSHDSVFHADGSMAEGPISLCEVQGYIYAAKRRASELAAVLGLTEKARRLQMEAQTLRDQFEDVFWCDDLSIYALALDGKKRPCRVRTSNAGHCLFTGIASPERAWLTAQTLLSEDMYSGWGIRTVASSEIRYNPMSYHNGSVWPHDNAVIAHGLASYGFNDLAVRLLTGLFDASLFVDLHRLPELFCGFRRRPGEGPTLYPVACSPQAWAAASVFMLLQACLGLSVRGAEGQVRFAYPALPECLQFVRISNLKVNEGQVDILIERHPRDVSINVMRRTGDVEVVVVK